MLLFALQRQATAGQVLEVLFHHSDPVDDWVAMRSGFLLLEICVHAYRGFAPGDTVAQPVLQSARRILEYLRGPRPFNEPAAIAAALAAGEAGASDDVKAATGPGTADGKASAGSTAASQEAMATAA